MSLIGFENWLLKIKKPSTVRLHLYCMKRVLKNVDPLTRDGFDSYVSSLKLQGLSTSYINTLMNAVCVYTEFLGDKWKMGRFKDKYRIKATMSDEEIEKFLSVPCPTFIGRNWNTGKTFERRSDPRGWEIMRIFWSIMAFTGMRPGEIAALTVETVDFGQEVFFIEDSKTNTPRLVPIAPRILPEIKKYVSVIKGEYLFPSRRGGSHKGKFIDSVDWGYNFHKRIKMLGIKRSNLTPYSLRHSFATSILPATNLFDTMELLGHKDPNTTKRYYHNNIKVLKKAIALLPLNITSPYDRIKILRDFIISLELKPGEFDVRLETGKIEVKIKGADSCMPLSSVSPPPQAPSSSLLYAQLSGGWG